MTFCLIYCHQQLGHWETWLFIAELHPGWKEGRKSWGQNHNTLSREWKCCKGVGAFVNMENVGRNYALGNQTNTATVTRNWKDVKCVLYLWVFQFQTYLQLKGRECSRVLHSDQQWPFSSFWRAGRQNKS